MKSVRLLALRPNNWYIHRDKLERVRMAWENGEQDQLSPVLVTEIDGGLSLIDGHSRAYTAFERGETHIAADIQKLEEIEGSSALYRHIHREGPKREINTIADLREKIVSSEGHRRLWVGYCSKWLDENENLSEK
jgi:hypothetical protein